MSLNFIRNCSSFPSPYRSLVSLQNKEICIKKLKGIKQSLKPHGKAEVAKQAAILVPIVEIQNEPALVYTKRSKYLTNHKGQVSFPGGNSDETDSGPEQTALRETWEEIGIPPESVEVWATLPALVSSQRGASAAMATPVVGFINNFDQSKLVISKEEVDQVFAVKLSELCSQSNCKYTQFRFDGSPGYSMPMFDVPPFPIWGLTAIITYQVLKALVPSKHYRHKISFQTPLVKTENNKVNVTMS